MPSSKLRGLIPFLICGPLATTACQNPLDREQAYSELHSDSGITGSAYAEIIGDLRAFAETHKSQMTAIDYGTSAGGKTLTAFRLIDLQAQPQGKRPAILLSEGIHGDEYTNIVDRLPEKFLGKSPGGESAAFGRFLKAGGVVLLVPIVNPDGYDGRRRENAAGKDLNRDFTIKAAGNQGFTQPETRAISKFVAAQVEELNLSLEASMEYHCCIGGMIHPWAYSANPLPAATLARHREFGEKMRGLLGYSYGTVREIVGYNAVGGSDDYYLETYGRRAFSFEGRQGVEDRNLDKHAELWEGLFRDLAAEPDPTEPVYVALAETSSGELLLGVSVAKNEKAPSLCLGTKTACALPDAPKVSLTLEKTVGDRRLYRATRPIKTNATSQIVTVTLGDESATGFRLERI